MSTGIYRSETGEWVTNWFGRIHHVQFEPQDYATFMSLGLSEAGAVLIETTALGVIESVISVKSREPVDLLEIPQKHALHSQIKIGKPYANKVSVSAGVGS